MSDGSQVFNALVVPLLPPPVGNPPEAVDGRVIFENHEYRPAPGEAFLTVHWRPGAESVASMDAVVTREAGALRVMAYAELSDGPDPINELADAVMALYPLNGPRLFADPWNVTVTGLHRGAVTRLEGWQRVIVDISYIAVRS